MKRTDDIGIGVINHISKYKSLEKTQYLSGLGKIADAYWSAVLGVTTKFSDTEIASSFKNLSSGYLKEISAETDLPIKWYCDIRSKEAVPCNLI